MPFSNTVAALYGRMAMHAMDMFRTQPASMTPEADPRLGREGWEVVGYVSARDTAFPKAGLLTRQPMQVLDRTVYYGYFARRGPSEFAVVIRGTDGLVEWIEDGDFLPVHYAPQTPLPFGPPAAAVEQGFFMIYSSMTLLDERGAPLGPLVSALIERLQAPGASITVVGHSLGAALATYLTLELARAAPDGLSVQACLFASPQTGNRTFVEAFDRTVVDYRLFNYQLDVVPHVPFGPDYAPLPRRTIIQPATAEASIRFNVGCNHHVICYCAMLDYEGTKAVAEAPPAGEEGSAACILGPETGAPSIAKVMASVVGGVLPI